jgi:hypothetical protein
LNVVGSSEARGQQSINSPFAVNPVCSYHLGFDDYAFKPNDAHQTRPLYSPCKLVALPIACRRFFFGEDGFGETLSGSLFRCVLLDGQSEGFSVACVSALLTV